MSNKEPLASFSYSPGGLDAVLEFLKRTRSELRELRMVRVWPDRVQIYDVNSDYFEIAALGYPDEDITPLLTAIGTTFKPQFIHNPIDAPYKEFKTGRRHPWAEDRVM